MKMKRECLCCGAPQGMARFEGRALEVSYQDLKRTVPGLAGWACSECDEVEFDADSALRYAKAGDELIEDARQAVAEEMKRMRKRLNRTQKQMVAIAGGGHNAFSRYERAEVEPPRALWVLLTLLDRNPSLIQQVEQIAAEGAVKLDHLVAEKGKARLEY